MSRKTGKYNFLKSHERRNIKMDNQKNGTSKMIKNCLAGIVLVILFSSCIGVDDSVDKIKEACSGMTFEELKTQNGISDKCRDAVYSASLLPDGENDFNSKIIILGGTTSGGATVYYTGVDSGGTGLSTSDLSGVTVKVTQNGTETTLNSSQYTISSLAESTENAVSMGVVIDYSGSMRDKDLDEIANFNQDFFTYFPTIYESSVYYFSETPTLKQDFTSDKNTILSATTRDITYKRASTALYDAMGMALDDLVARSSPVKLLIVATDGLENASVQYTKAQIVSKISDNKVFVVMLGALFADVSELKALKGSRGIYFYDDAYSKFRSEFTKFTQSLGNVHKLTTNSEITNVSKVTISSGSYSGNFE